MKQCVDAQGRLNIPSNLLALTKSFQTLPAKVVFCATDEKLVYKVVLVEDIKPTDKISEGIRTLDEKGRIFMPKRYIKEATNGEVDVFVISQNLFIMV